MALKVYGIPMSTATAIVLTCLSEKGVEYELVPVDLSKGEHKSPSFLSKNNLEQSLDTWAHKYKGTGTDIFRHEKLEEAAMVRVWIEVESQQFSPPMCEIIYQKFIMPLFGKPPNQSVIDANVEKLGVVFDVYEARLSNTKYLACNSFTLADLHHLPYIYYLMKTPWADLINSRPHVKAWWEDISARTSFIKVAHGLILGA